MTVSDFEKLVSKDKPISNDPEREFWTGIKERPHPVRKNKKGRELQIHTFINRLEKNQFQINNGLLSNCLISTENTFLSELRPR